MSRAIALTLSCAVLALTGAACGEAGSGDDADPASLVPAGAPVYFEATVRPEGDLREDALAALGKVMRTDDPSGRLRELIDEGLADEGSGLTWEKDFSPWLGEQAGAWMSDFGGEEPAYAVVVATKDAEAAAAALEKFKKTGDNVYTGRAHAGVDYAVDESGVAVGMVDDFMVFGTEGLFKRSVDMREDGESLADSDRYKDAVDELKDERLGEMYMDTKAIVDASLAEDPEAARQFEQFKSILPFDKLGPTVASLQADGDGISIDSVMAGVPDGPFRRLAELTSGGKTELMPELPGDAWGAFALPRVGESGKTLFDAFAGALGGAAVSAQVKQATGLDLEQDIFSWIGDVGMFVRGTTQPELDGALVIQATDDAKADGAFGKLIGLIGKQAGVRPEPVHIEGAESAFSLAMPDAEQPIVLARGEGRVVAGYGERAAADALASDARLRDADLYRDGGELLDDGMEPSVLLSIPDVIALADAMGATQDPEFGKARPYLEALGTVVAGGKLDGDRVESRMGVTLK